MWGTETTAKNVITAEVAELFIAFLKVVRGADGSLDLEAIEESTYGALVMTPGGRVSSFLE